MATLDILKEMQEHLWQAQEGVTNSSSDIMLALSQGDWPGKEYERYHEKLEEIGNDLRQMRVELAVTVVNLKNE